MRGVRRRRRVQDRRPWKLGAWKLENLAIVAELRAGLQDIVVPAGVLAQWQVPPEVHDVLSDTSGTRLAVEIVGGEIKVFDAPPGRDDELAHP